VHHRFGAAFAGRQVDGAEAVFLRGGQRGRAQTPQAAGAVHDVFALHGLERFVEEHPRHGTGNFVVGHQDEAVA
jgi:hypothetical protein